jgi:dehydrogenase/reductase SDR family protein 7B
MRRFDDRVAVVTGASSGIGRRLALDLARRGATVVALARREALLDEVSAEMREFSPASESRVCDVSRIDLLRDALAGIEARHGRIDVLINNAGIDEPTSIAAATPVEVFERIMATNYFAVVAATLAVIPGMRERRRGIVVNVSSDSARAPEPRDGGYAASKAAVSAFTESVAHEVATDGVHVHVLYPAWVPTAMGLGDNVSGKLPPRPVRRTEAQVSSLVLNRMGGPNIDINAAALPKLAVIGRTFVPRLYQRAMRSYEAHG